MGSYAESLLAPGETVIHRSRQHWLSLVLDSRLAIVLWVTAIIAIVISFFVNDPGMIGQAFLAVEGIAIVAGIIVVAWRWWNWRTQEYLITNRRLMNVSGVINKRSADSSLEKINDAILEENLVGRLLGYGDLDILTAADTAIDRYRMLKAAKDFKKQMLQAKHALESGLAYSDAPGRTASAPSTAAPGVTPPTPDAAPAAAPLADPVDTAEEVTAALGRLAELRDKGAITASDYEIKKRELLSRL